MSIKGLKIITVEPGSVAEEAGLEPGDSIVTVNGHEIPDELALQFSLSNEYIEMLVRKEDGTAKLAKIDLSDPSDLGLQVEEFRTRTCNNACIFCFVDQLPPGVRPSLRVKDDDYRLSFLHGNYVTLTNLSEKELDRIVEHRLSPMYVSIHATDPELRARMLGLKRIDNLGRKIDRLIRGGIRIHAQIVLMPGINDGMNLKKTVHDLLGLHPGIQSIAVVPLGISDHGKIKHRFTPVTPQFSKDLIRQVAPWQEQCRKEIGETFVYLADEFYLQSGTSLPDTSYYGDFAQIEDGIGMTRNFLDEFKASIRRRRSSLAGLRGTVATGRLFFPTLRDCMEDFNLKFGSDIRTGEVRNSFLGRGITVAGLLAGIDFLKSFKKRDLGNFLIIPQESLSRVDGIFLDDFSPADLAKKLGIPVYPSGRTVSDFFKLLFRLGALKPSG